MKIKLLLFAFLIFYCTKNSQAQVLPGDTIWTKIYPQNSFDDIIEAADGNIFALSSSPPTVYKTDSSGNLLWTKSYSSNASDGGYSLLPTADGGFVLAGTNLSLAPVNKDIWVIRCNANGDTIWTGSYNPPGYDGYSVGYRIREDIWGNFLICGLADSSPGNQDMILVKINSIGGLIWSKTFGGQLAEEATDFDILSDESAILTGYTRSFGNASRALWIVKVSSNGDSVWTKTIVRNNEQWGRAIGALPNNDFIIGGWNGPSSANKEIWLLRFNSNGDTIWTKQLTSVASLSQINSLVITPSKKIAFTGMASFQFTVGVSDSLGDLEWMNPYGSQVGLCITQTLDGNFLASGQKSYMNAWIFKIHSGEPPLPVELISFSASINGNNVELNWTTATEINNKGFEIEKSISSASASLSTSVSASLSTSWHAAVSNWESIGFVNGAGTTTHRQNYSFTDKNVSEGKYFYRLKQIDFDGSFEYSNEIEIEIGQPTEFVLYQNYPNPFNPSTKISWQSAVSSWQTLKVFDVLGNEIFTLINEYRTAGSYQIKFDSKNLPSGIYFYKLQIGSFTDVKKMILTR